MSLGKEPLLASWEPMGQVRPVCLPLQIASLLAALWTMKVIIKILARCCLHTCMLTIKEMTLSRIFKFLTLVAVPVGGKNFFKLMQNGEAALLYPGGVREVCKLPSFPSISTYSFS